jgi:spermidine synthase
MSDAVKSDPHAKPFIAETLVSKSLHFSSEAVQSCMNMLKPHDLMLEYTRTMMGFLLFNPQPDNIAMIGLGGGSLAKFCYRYLPDTRIVAIEVNPHVVALRDAFQVPKDDHRFTVVQGDGALYVRCPPKRYDVLMLDGFDGDGLPPRLCSQRFYEQCHDALHPKGIMVANFHSAHPHHQIYLARIRNAFKDSVLVVNEPEGHNSTVFACKGQLLRPLPEGPLSRPRKLPEAAWKQLETALKHIASCMHG